MDIEWTGRQTNSIPILLPIDTPNSFLLSLPKITQSLLGFNYFPWIMIVYKVFMFCKKGKKKDEF